MKLLIRGCAHSGTRYMAKYLNTLGISVGHERVDRGGVVTWYFNDACKNISGEGYVYLQQTRKPLKTIEACQYLSTDSWAHIRTKINIPRGRSFLFSSMNYYYYWNKLIEKNTLFQYCVEETSHILDILDLFKITYKNENVKKANKINKKVGHNNKKDRKILTYEDLYKEDEQLTDKIIKQEQKYYVY